MNPQTTDYSPHKQSKLPTIVLGLLLLLALAFGLWAYGQSNTYKSNLDTKVSSAVSLARKDQTTIDQKKADDEAKSPYSVFQGSATYGTVTFNYPKSWSAYDNSDTNESINAYFHPILVPNITSTATYPLRVELLTTDYTDAINQLSAGVTDGSVKASAYIPPKMKSVPNVQPGTRFDGAISQTSAGAQQGSMVIIKVRDKTLQISTQSQDSVKDFDNIVLASLTFAP